MVIGVRGKPISVYGGVEQAAGVLYILQLTIRRNFETIALQFIYYRTTMIPGDTGTGTGFKELWHLRRESASRTLA
jgi:hypothetical protein